MEEVVTYSGIDYFYLGGDTCYVGGSWDVIDNEYFYNELY